MVIGRTKEKNEINMAIHFTCTFLIQFVYQESFWLKQRYLLLFIYSIAILLYYVCVYIYIYIYIYIGTKGNYTEAVARRCSVEKVF